MLDILLETIIDSLKLLPFLFLTYLLMEYLEHKMSDKTKKIIKNAGKAGPFYGAILGAFPQCGFSVAASNLYCGRVITLGTLIAIYLSTSDEMLPILISRNVEFSLILKILSIKLIVGIIFGFIIDLVYSKKEKQNYQICKDDDCHCKEGIIHSTLKHTFNILIFIFVINLILNIMFEYLGNDYLSKIFLKDSIFSPFITSLVGLIPNCGSSVMIKELYLNNAISFVSMLSGLLTGSGVAILVLFKTNKNIKENLKILSMIYLIGVLSGIIIDLFNLI